jgi:REP element-mobilizing transposase RayT
VSGNASANTGHRRSIRLPAHDYATAGSYFFTINVDDREPRFGEIVNGEAVLWVAGLMVESWWGNIARRFPSVSTDAYVVMPNHFHGIVMLGAVAGSDHGGRQQGDHIGSPVQSNPTNPADKPPALGDIVGWFKTMTTWDYGIGVRNHGWPPYHRRLWHRNYYERIIRNDAELDRIRAYIAGNPGRWTEDVEYRPARDSNNGAPHAALAPLYGRPGVVALAANTAPPENGNEPPLLDSNQPCDDRRATTPGRPYKK